MRTHPEAGRESREVSQERRFDSYMLTFRMVGADKLLKALAKAPQETRRSTEKALKKAGHLVEREAKKNLTAGRPLNVRSNTLRSSIRVKVDKAKLEARVGTNVVYGPIHEFGGTIPAHTIKPRFAKALRWLSPAGIAMFAKSVRIPAFKMPRRPWLQPAFDASRGKIKQAFAEEISGGLARLR